MIQPNELRIGNEIWNGRVTRIEDDCFYFHDGFQEWKSTALVEGTVMPLPLSTGILENCGLINNGGVYCAPEDIRQMSANDIGVQYCAFFFNARLNRWMDSQTRVCVRHLHQLQNLYFALTGTELNYQPH